MAALLIATYPDIFLQQENPPSIADVFNQYPQSLLVDKNNTFIMMASCNPTLDYVNQNKNELKYFKTDIAFAAISCFALFFVAALILTDRKLQAHPNKLIAYVFICDAYTFF